ncbi:unnamed protein product, partial [Prorocentrum cordatum]
PSPGPRTAWPEQAPALLGGSAAQASALEQLLRRQVQAAEEVLACSKAISNAVHAQTGSVACPVGAAPAGPSARGLGGAVVPALAEPLLGARGGKVARPRLPIAAVGGSPAASASVEQLNDVRDKVEDILSTRRLKVSAATLGEYADSGCCVAAARSPLFHSGTLVMISLNTLWIAIDTDCNTAEFLDEAPVLFQVVDNLFCLFFTFELLVRVLAMRRPRDALRDPWILFDMFLVMMMVLETWILTFFHAAWGLAAGSGALRGGPVLRIFRVMRLTRLARMARLMRSVPELLVLVKGLTVAIRSVTCTLGLLLLVIYCFAVLFVQLLGRKGSVPKNGAQLSGGEELLDGAFSSVPWAMHTLLMQVLCGFDAVFITKLLRVGWMYYLLFLFYALLGYLTILNLLIGILCEVVANVASVEKQAVQWELLEQRVQVLMRQLDLDNSGLLSESEFMELMDKPEVLEELESLGVDVAAFMDFIHFVFKDTNELPERDFLKMLKPFQGENVARVKDLVDVNKFITVSLRNFEQRLFSTLEEHLVSRLARKEWSREGRPETY